jgi:hypothetical protein
MGGSALASAAPVRAPTAAERAAVLAGVRWIWGYETRIGRVPAWVAREHPQVVAVRVSRSVPAYASAAVVIRGPGGRSEPGGAIVVLERRGGSWRRYGEPDVVAGPATSFAWGCSQATAAGLRALLCPDPWRVLGAQAPVSGNVQQTLREPLAPGGLRHVDWQSAELPGGVCDASSPIRLRRGYASVRGPLDGWWARLDVELAGAPPRVSYGELAGRPAAAVEVLCSNAGGTADGQLISSDVVFLQSAGSLRAIGILTPRQPPSAATAHIPLEGAVRFAGGRLEASEYWYGPSDPTCCASGRARTLWAYRGGALRALRTTVLRKP